MNVSTEKIEKNKTVLTITVPQAEVAKAYDKAWRSLSARLSVPGFRKGKAPRKIVEARVGLPAIKEEAFELIAQKAYPEALDEAGVQPVSRPDVDIVTLEEDQDMVLKVTVTTRPEVELGQYVGLSGEKSQREITDADVDEVLGKMRDRKASMVVSEDGVLQKGDFAVIDFLGTVDGQLFSGGEGKGYPLEIGSGSFIPGFEDQLVGAKTGEERTVDVAFPADYFAKELAGKQASFQVTVHDVKRKQLPEVTDEFIKENSEFATVAEWKADCRENLEKAAALSAQHEHDDKLVKAAVENATVDVPAVMVEDRVSEIVRDITQGIQQRGLKFEDYLKYLGKTFEELRESYKTEALADIKAELVMDAIAQKEDIKAEAQDLEQEVERMAAQYKQPVEEVKKRLLQTGNLQLVSLSIIRRKAAQFIVEKSRKD